MSLGAANLNYYQTGFGNFYSKTGLLSLRYVTPSWGSRLGLYANGNLTVLTVSSASSAPGNYAPELIEGRLDATFRLHADPPSATEEWQFFLVGGAAYLTMLANGSPFGFANLFGPEFGFRLNYVLEPGSMIVSDVHYAPMAPKDGNRLAPNLEIL